MVSILPTVTVMFVLGYHHMQTYKVFLFFSEFQMQELKEQRKDIVSVQCVYVCVEMHRVVDKEIVVVELQICLLCRLTLVLKR